MRRTLALVLLSLGPLVAGCATVPSNPTFSITRDEARRDLDAMARHTMPLARPVLILGGFADPGYSTTFLEVELRRVISNDQFTTILFVDCTTFDECRRHLIEKVESRFPSSDPRQTTEVDVVAASMGGLVARYAAKAAPGTEPLKRLRMARLMTIATPHRGAILANWPTLNSLALQMRPDSEFLRDLNRAPITPNYQIIPYVWTNDNIVGAGNTAPPGMIPWWLPPIPLDSPHIGALRDSRIVADIARRLRNERPYTMQPPAPLPPGATATGP